MGAFLDPRGQRILNGIESKAGEVTTVGVIGANTMGNGVRVFDL